MISVARRGGAAVGARPRAALLVGTALGTALVGLTYGTNPAMAACTASGNGNQTVDTNLCGLGTGSSVTSNFGSATVNLNGDLINNTGNGITGTALQSVTITPTGTRSVTGTTNGIYVTPTLGNANVNLTDVTVHGLGGDGVYAHTTVGSVNITGNAATNVNGTQDGMDLATTVGAINANGFTGSSTGGINGINASALGGTINLNSFAGHADGQTGAGITASVLGGTINLNDFAAAGHAEGGTDGIALSALGGTINLNNFAGLSEGDTGAGIRATTTFGTINANGFTGRAEGGTDGLYFQSTLTGNINLNDFSGRATGTTGTGISAQTLGGNVAMDNFTGNATGGTDGIFAAAGGTLDFSQTSSTSIIQGGVNGLNFQQGFGAVDVDLAGQVTGNTNGLVISSMPIVGQTSLSDIDVDTTSTSLVRGITGNGIDISKASLGGNVNVTSNGVTMGGDTGISVLSLIGGDTTTTITNNGKTSGGAGGISSITASLTGTGTTLVDLNNQQLDGGTGIGVLALTGGSVVSGTGNASTTVNVNAGSGIVAGSGVLAGSYSGGGMATTHVQVDEEITANSGFGVIAFAAGEPGMGSTATVENTAAVEAAGSGLITAALNGNAETTVNNTVSFDGFVGAGAFAYEGDATVNVNDKISTTNGIFGALAVSYGGNATVISDANGEIDPPVIGMGAVAIGPGTATVTNGALVQATGVGLLGVSISDPVLGAPGPGLIDINANAQIQSDGIGILAVKGGDGNTDIDVDAAIGDLSGTNTGGDGIQVFNFAGDGLVTVDTTANGTINSDDDGISITKIFGDGDLVSGNAVVVNTNAAIIAGDDGIQVSQLFGDGAISVTSNAAITAGDVGIDVTKGFGDGAITVTSNDIITAGGDGISATQLFGDGAIGVTSNAAITSGDVGIDVFKAFGDGDITVLSHGAIVAANDGISATQLFGDGNIFVQNTGTITSGADGIQAIKVLGEGNVGVQVDNDISAADDGVFALSAATLGDVRVDLANNTLITAGDDGIQVVTAANVGNAVVNTGAFSGITAGDDGINVTKAVGLGSVYVNTGAFSFIDAGDDGIRVSALLNGGFTSLDVDTGAFSFINAGDDGIQATQTLSGGAVRIDTGFFSGIVAGDDGIRAGSYASVGSIDINTGDFSAIAAGDDGIVAEAYAGFGGDVSVTTGAFSLLAAGDDGITAINYNIGAGNNVNVTTGFASATFADDKGIRAGGWDNVIVNVGDNSLLVGGLDAAADGNAIKVFDSDLAAINIGSNAVVVGSGQGWNGAVISVESDDATYINVFDGALVTSGSLFSTGLSAAANSIVIDADGAAADIDNYGTIIGRVGLTDNADVFNNYSSNTWITVGNNYFGNGADLLNNEGRIVSAVDGTVAETTSFFGLDEFRNGDPAGLNAGTLSMVDNDTLGRTAARDVTYTNGVFVAQNAGPLGTYGNSRIELDTWLGQAGSTSDMLVVGGLDDAGVPLGGQSTFGRTELYINDVNGGTGAFNLPGILVVDVQNGQTFNNNFVIAPDSPNYDPKFGGVIDKGLFFYDMVTKGDGAGGTGHYLVGLPDQEVFQLPSLITGAQSIWHETTGVWLDRQVDLRSYLLNPTTTTTTIVTKDRGVVKAPVAGEPTNVTPGIWGKAIGSWSSRDNTSSYSAYGNTYNFDTGYNQDTYGFMVGADFGKTTGNTAFLFGVMGGYINSTLDFNELGTSADYTGGSVGAYATYLNGGFFIDGLFKADFLSLDYSAPSLAKFGYVGQSSDVTSLGVVIDTGYRFAWGASAWFEPVATFTYVNSSIDNLTLLPGTWAEFQDGDSVRGAIGARVGGKMYDAATYWVEASATGRLWYEFAGDNNALIYNPGLPFMANDTFDGAFGEFTGSFNWFSKENGLNGFVNGRIFFNDAYTAGSAVLGVRYQW